VVVDARDGKAIRPLRVRAWDDRELGLTDIRALPGPGAEPDGEGAAPVSAGVTKDTAAL
jgi:hypothetical protein